ncbi:MAG: tetratricopeptide repeat protein, partial [Planctomycetes bacterium]|nr:tetratricopeptide repeat protein [Planctomycetota bacterium]
ALALLLIVGLVILAAAAALRLFQPGHLDAGLDQFARGDYEGAIDVFDRVLASDGSNEEARYYRAIALRKDRRIDEAINDLVALRVQPKWAPRAFRQIVIGYLESDRVELARAEIEQVEDEITKNSIGAEAMGIFHLGDAQARENELARRLEQDVAPREGKYISQLAARAIRATSRNFSAATEKILERLKNERVDADVAVQIDGELSSAHDAVVSAINWFEKAASLADEGHGLPVARSHYELGLIAEFRRLEDESEIHWRALVGIELDDLKDDLDLWEETSLLRDRGREKLLKLLIDMERFQEAVDVAREVPADDRGLRPFEIDALLARAHEGLGQDDLMLEIVDRRLAKVDTVEMNFLRGRYHAARGEWEAALPYFEKALYKNRQRDHIEALARANLALKRYDIAASLFDELSTANPNSWEYLLLHVEAMEGNQWLTQARETMVEALRQPPFGTPGSVGYRRIRSYLDAFLDRNHLAPHDLYSAQTLYEEDPSNFDVARRYLDFLLASEATGKARLVVARIMDNCPTTDQAYYDVMLSCGRFSRMVGREAKAGELFRKAIATRPWEPDPRFGLAEAALAQGLTGVAWSEVQRLENLVPDDARLPDLRFRIALSEGNPKLAARETEAIMAGLGGTRNAPFEVVVNLGRAWLATGETKRVVKLVGDQRLDILTNADQGIEYGLLLIEAGQEDKGLQLVQKFVSADPTDRERVAKVAARLSQWHKHELQVALLEPLVLNAFHPDDGQIRYLAEAYRALGKNESFLNMADRLLQKGRTQQAYLWIADFCREHGQVTEILSLADAADRDNAMSADLLWMALDVAFEASDAERARNYLRKLQLL